MAAAAATADEDGDEEVFSIPHPFPAAVLLFLEAIGHPEVLHVLREGRRTKGYFYSPLIELFVFLANTFDVKEIFQSNDPTHRTQELDT